MKRKEIIQGVIYGNLEIICEISPYIDISGRKHRRVKTLCKCGNEKDIILSSLITGNTTSCGCKCIKHKLTTHKLYGIWSSMKQRCYDTAHRRYTDWGGRGITVCDIWKNDFKNFYDWCYSNGYKEGLQLERKNNNLGYYPENCTFVSRQVQCNNRRTSVFYEYMGEKLTLPMICKKLNLSDKYNLIRQRISRDNQPLEKALIF